MLRQSFELWEFPEDKTVDRRLCSQLAPISIFHCCLSQLQLLTLYCFLLGWFWGTPWTTGVFLGCLGWSRAVLGAFGGLSGGSWGPPGAVLVSPSPTTGLGVNWPLAGTFLFSLIALYLHLTSRHLFSPLLAPTCAPKGLLLDHLWPPKSIQVRPKSAPSWVQHAS